MNKMLFAVSALVIWVSALCPGCLDNGSMDDDHTILLYGFSVKGEVLNEKIIPSFKQYWKELTGEEVDFQTSYAGSGKITSQVLNGAPAEVMVLSTEWDAMELMDQGMVTADWRMLPYNGTVTTSPWVIMTRDDNPRSIEDFRDLAGDVEIVHADPMTSGGARWSVFSVYGSELRNSNGTLEERKKSAEKLLREIGNNVISWQSSARKALSQFTLGYGDAFITYENDAMLSIEKGKPVDIVYPRSTILSEHKVVMVDHNIGPGERELVEAFIDYLFTEEVQSYFVQYNFRSVLENLNQDLHTVEDPFTIEYLGGWESAMEEIVNGIFPDIREG
ncbi:MAG: substrate-binding domain-containing protein [Thermoplasmatota archaeon]